MVRLMQKERLKSPHEPLFYVTGPFVVGSFGSFLEDVFLVAQQHAIWVILASHFRTRMRLPKEAPLAVLLKF